jgi:hypothetical protein
MVCSEILPLLRSRKASGKRKKSTFVYVNVSVVYNFICSFKLESFGFIPLCIDEILYISMFMPRACFVLIF